MHKAATIESAVADATSTPRERIRYLARQLVEAAIWPRSAGFGIYPLGAGHAACLIFAVAYAEKGDDMAALVSDFGNLELQADPASPMAGMAGDTLLLTLAGLLAPECRFNVRLKLYRHAGGEAAADVILEDDDGNAMVVWPFWRSPHWSGRSRRTFELAPEGFEVLRNLLARRDLAELELKRA